MVAISAPLTAQDISDDEPPLVLDLSRSKTVLDEQCEAQADAARIAGEIVVCRSVGEASEGVWDMQSFEQDYAERTQGPKNPDVDGSGLILPTEGSIVTVTVTAEFGETLEKPVEVDLEALPEAPPGSDAYRIANGERP